MKKLIIFFFIFIGQFSFAQSILLEPGKQGLNNLNAPKGTIEMNGNGLLIQQKYKLTTADPNAQINLMQCISPYSTSTALAGIIKDPNGDGPYIGGIAYDCKFFIDLSAVPDVIGFRLIVEEANMGIGDILNAYPLWLDNNNSITQQGDTLLVFLKTFDFFFTSNTDNSVGNGFRIRWQALLADEVANPLLNYKGGNAAFAVDIKKGIFRFGTSFRENYSPNSISMGRNNRVDEGGIAIGNNAIAIQGIGGVAIGGGAFSFGTNTIALGNSSQAHGTNSFAVLGGDAHGSNNAVIGNSTAYGSNTILIGTGNFSSSANGVNNSFAIGENNRIDHASSIAIGKNLLTSNINNNIMGAFNGNNVATVTPLTPSARIFELGNGTAALARHNAITVLADGKMGIGVYAPTEILDVNGNVKISGNQTLAGNTTVNGTFRLGAGGSILNEIIKFTRTIDLPSIAALGTSLQTFALTGAELGSTVYVSPSASLNDGIVIASARVSALNTVDLKFTNITAAAINPLSMDFYITIIR
jgi:hypothetical protein